MIATNQYLELWKNCAISMIRVQSDPGISITIHLFTDQVLEAQEWWKKQETTINLVTHEIPNYVWPEATLFRYKIFSDHESDLQDDILIYLDSDMQFDDEMLSTLSPQEWINGLAFVRHPGFSRTPLRSSVALRFSNPSLILQDLKWIKLLPHGMGTWELDKSLKSYVPRSKRKCYFHGAIWMGRKVEIKKMISILAKRIQEDYEAGKIAIWHDESHLNWYGALNQVTILDSRYSWFKKYSHLKNVRPILESIDKTELNFVRYE